MAHSDHSAGRRRILLSGAALAGLAAFRASAQGSFDWQKYKGTAIEVGMQRTNFADSIKKRIPEFEALTGIKVGLEQIPEQQFRQKLVIELSSGTPSLDVVYIAYASQKRMIGKAKWLEDLRAYINDPAQTAPGFDLADFSAPSLAYATQADGRMDTIPTTIHYNLLVYNKELFAAKGVKPPATFAELLAAAKALNDPKNGIAGFVARGVKNANTPVWTTFLLGYGQEPIDKAGKFNTDTPEAIEAARMYTTLNKDFGPPGVVGFNWYECQANFMQGKSAMMIDTEGITGLTNDPKKSKVAGKVGYSVMPAGPKAHMAGMYGNGLGIPVAGKKKGAAWYFVQWATNKQNQVNLGADGAGAPARNSAHVALNALATPPVHAEWMDALTRSSKIARPCVPEIVAATEFRDVFGVALSNMLTGSDPAEQLKVATAQFKPVFAKSE